MSKGIGHTLSKHPLQYYQGLTLALCIGTILSIIAFIAALNINMHDLEQGFYTEAKEKTKKLTTELTFSEGGAELLVGFFKASDFVSQSEFNDFVQPLLHKGNFVSVLWIPEKKLANNIYRDRYCVSFDTNHCALLTAQSGDLSHTIDATAADSRQHNRPVLSSLLPISNSAQENSYLAMTYPIYKNKVLIGFTVGILDLQKVLIKTLDLKNPLQNQHVYLYSNNPKQPKKLFFQFDSSQSYFYFGYGPPISFDSIKALHPFNYSEIITPLAHKWQAVFVPTNKYIGQAANMLPWTILILGIFITGAIGIFLFYIISRNVQVEALVGERTANLQQATAKFMDSENRLKAVLDTVLDGIITINSKGIIQSFNPAAERIFQYNAKEVIGKNVNTLMPEPYHSNHGSYITNYLDTNQAKIIGIGREVKAKRKDGSIFPMDLGISNMMVSGGRMFVGILRDITARKEVEVELEEERTKAERANHAKSEFLATMSHEIRTPLNSIVATSEMLKSMQLRSDQAEHANMILNSGEILLSIINNILDFSKIDAGELTVDPIPLIIPALLTEVTSLLLEQANKHNVELIVRIAGNVPYCMLGDNLRIRQILINLVSNAIKFTQNGHVLIDIYQDRMVDNIVHLRFEVQDTGIGISAEKKDVIFDKFSQADASTTRHFGGTGLGLAICKRLVELMHGTIGVESEVGKGSTFWFELPLPIFGLEIPSESQTFESLTGKQLLLVEDCGTTAKVLSEYLTSAQLQCEVVPSGSQALSLLHDRSFDFILIDETLPDSNGEALAKAIRRDPKHQAANLIALIPVSSIQNAGKLYRAGFNALLMKPIYKMLLLKTLTGSRDANLLLEDFNPMFLQNYSNLTFHAKILVVEDYPPNQEIIRKILTNLKCSVSIASNGEEAINMLEKEPHYDVIFMDCQMPDMDGYQTTKVIRSRPWGESLKIIAVTANAFQKDKDTCIEAGMNDYIAKPIRIQDIISILNIYVDKSKQGHTQEPPVEKHYAATNDNTPLLEKKVDVLQADLDTLSYVLSHDFKTPLYAIADLVDEQKNPSDPSWSAVESYINRLKLLQDSVLEFSRLSTTSLPFKEVDTQEVVQAAVESLGEKAANATITYLQLPHVSGRKTHLIKLFCHLLENALKFNQQKQPNIEVSATLKGTFWEFAVKDNGIGIPEELQETVFILFQRNPEVKDIPGIGSGLTFAKKIVESHGGSMWVASLTGQGSTFYFTLPDVDANKEVFTHAAS